MPGMPAGSEGPYRAPGAEGLYHPEGVTDEVREAFATDHEPIVVPEPIDTTHDLEEVKKRLGIKDAETPDLSSFGTGSQVPEDATPSFSSDVGVTGDDLLKE
jgi:hypothetical protein